MKKNANGLSTRKIMIVGLLGSITIVLGAIPGLGFILLVNQSNYNAYTRNYWSNNRMTFSWRFDRTIIWII